MNGPAKNELIGGLATQSQRIAAKPHVQAMAEEYFNSPDRLAGDTLPAIAIECEKPIHRMMIYLHAQGASISDIAQHTGYKAPFVCQILKQPWARQRLLQILKESGQDEVRHFLTHEVAPSLQVLREIRDGDIPGKASDRLQAADKILDRALGKPTVSIESSSTVRNVPADLQRIEADLESTRAQLASRGVTDGAN